MILYFRRVDILDSTGMLRFRKLKYVTNTLQKHLIITAPSMVRLLAERVSHLVKTINALQDRMLGRKTRFRAKILSAASL